METLVERRGRSLVPRVGGAQEISQRRRAAGARRAQERGDVEGGAVRRIGDALGRQRVQQRNAVVAEPAEHPPESARETARIVVVHYHLRTRVDRQPGECRSKRLNWWQRMSSVRSGFFARKIAVNVRVHRPRNVSSGIRTLPGRGVCQVEPAVYDHQRRIIQDRGERRCVNQGCVAHPSDHATARWQSRDGYGSGIYILGSRF